MSKMANYKKLYVFPVTRRLPLWAGLLAVYLCFGTGVIEAQTSTGSIAGSVRDPSNALVVDARITATNQATNESRTTRTNDSGYYSFPLLPPATYRLEVEATGFKRFVREDVRLDVALALTANVTLEVGAATEEITVTAAAASLESENASLSHLIENQRIINLPINGRNAFAYIGLVPGVRGVVGGEQTAYGMYNDQFVSIMGSRPNQSTYLMDGGTDTEAAFNGPAVFPSVDSIQEYKVQTNNYTAEFPHTAGGVINVVTKSGTNQLHGSLFEFVRNDKLGANDFFANAAGRPMAALRFNEFGATAGGPLIVPKYNGKNRTFVFLSYDGLRWTRPLPTSGTMPTLPQRLGNFSQTFNQAGQMVTVYDPLTSRPDPNSPGNYLRSAFPGNVIPANRIDPVTAAILNYLPDPNAPGNALTAVNNFYSSYPFVTDKDGFAVRVDHLITQNHRVFARVSRNMTHQTRDSIYGPQDKVASPTYGNDQMNQIAAVVDYTAVLRSDLVLELSSSFTRYGLQRIPPSGWFNPVQLGFPSSFNQLYTTMIPCFPSVSVTGLGVTIAMPDAGGGFLGACGLLHDGYDHWLEAANWSYTKGVHTLKFGGDFGTERLLTARNLASGPSLTFTPGFTQGPSALVASSTAGVGFASFLLGNGSGSVPTSGVTPALLFRYYGFFVQDDWKITPRLTINLGVRYDYDSPWTERYNQLTNFNYTAPSPVSVPGLTLQGGLMFPGVGGLPRGDFNPDRNNVGPRFGFAYQLRSTTVIRGGFGLFYAPITGAGFNGQGLPTSGWSASTTWVGTAADGVTPLYPLSNPIPNGFQFAPRSSQGLATLIGQSVNALDRDRQTPYAEQWNFGIQQLLPRKTLLEVVYAGSRGVHLFGNLNVDQMPNQDLTLGSQLTQTVPNPFYGMVTTGTLSTAQVSRYQLLRPYPQFTGVTIGNTSYGASTYHALQTKLERRFSGGFSFLISYTFSKLMDDVAASVTGFPGENFGADSIQNYDNRRNERSVADFDTPHSLVINAVYELPAGPGKKFLSHGPLSQILGGWQLNGISTFRSGPPLEMGTSVNTLYNGGGTLRANWNGQDPETSGSVSSRVNNYINLAAFSLPAPYTFGNSPREMATLRAPGLADLDLSLFKNFTFKERFRLQFRGEAFNLMNHPFFSPPNTTLGSSTAGVISTCNNATARDIQLAVKLLF